MFPLSALSGGFAVLKLGECTPVLSGNSFWKAGLTPVGAKKETVLKYKPYHVFLTQERQPINRSFPCFPGSWANKLVFGGGKHFLNEWNLSPQSALQVQATHFALRTDTSCADRSKHSLGPSSEMSTRKSCCCSRREEAPCTYQRPWPLWELRNV